VPALVGLYTSARIDRCQVSTILVAITMTRTEVVCSSLTPV